MNFVWVLGIETIDVSAMIKYVAEFKDDRTKFNQIVSSGVILFLVHSSKVYI